MVCSNGRFFDLHNGDYIQWIHSWSQAQIDAHPDDQDTAGNSTLIVGDLIYVRS